MSDLRLSAKITIFSFSNSDTDECSEYILQCLDFGRNISFAELTRCSNPSYYLDRADFVTKKLYEYL